MKAKGEEENQELCTCVYVCVFKRSDQFNYLF